MKLSKDLWQQLAPLFTDALDMTPAARAAWLKDLDTTQPLLSESLRQLLATHDRAERLREMETVPRLAPTPPPFSDYVVGARIGPFQLLKPIGRGGMGEVWLAEQTDGRVERKVALKLPMTSQRGEVWRERFRRERDILAKLNHPHIATLYDAGVSEAEGSKGQPYLAMEFVEGESFADYVNANKLALPARLKLFRQVLEAVAHAHRHLVVHRDLKPANILIDKSGQVKLLDFGIAKLIDDDTQQNAAAALTQLGGRVMTLRYAAPEQVADAVISTATDVYALGVILHELVTGLSPYRAVREDKPLTEAALLTEEVGVPSSLTIADVAANERGVATGKQLARALTGDLDAIVLKALRRNPADRYATVEQFDNDILQHLEHRPVAAREGTWRYLAGRFAARNKLPIAAAAAVLLTMIAGLVLVEQQRRVAVAEKARAEKHFASVRKLANSFMFDVHSEIENLAGSLKARQTLIGTALQYLDSLAGEAANDTELALEVATAYRKLAEIKGNIYTSNLGKTASARQNVERAASLLDAIDTRQPDNINVLRERRTVAILIARMLANAGDAAALNETQKAISIGERMVALPEANARDHLLLAGALAEHGFYLATLKADAVTATSLLTRAIASVEKFIGENTGDIPARVNLASVYERASIVAESTGKKEDLVRAIELLEKSVSVTEALMRDDAANLLHRNSLARRYTNLAQSMGKANELTRASPNAAKGVAMMEQMTKAEPENVGHALAWFRALAVASYIESEGGHHDKASAFASLAIDAYTRLPAESRDSVWARGTLAGARGFLGRANFALAGNASLPQSRRIELLKQARTQFAQCRAYHQEMVAKNIEVVESTKSVEELDTNIKDSDALLARLNRN